MLLRTDTLDATNAIRNTEVEVTALEPQQHSSTLQIYVNSRWEPEAYILVCT